MTNKIASWAKCADYRGWEVRSKIYKGAMFYKAFRAGAETASYRSLPDIFLVIDLTEGE